MWLPVSCHPFWAASLARYLLSTCFLFAFWCNCICFLFARHLLLTCSLFAFRLSREKSTSAANSAWRTSFACRLPRPIDALAYHRRPCIYVMRTVCGTRWLPTSTRASKPKRQSVKGEAPPKTRQTTAGSGGVVEFGGELPARHDRPRRDEFLSRSDSWRSVPMTTRPPAVSTFS